MNNKGFTLVELIATLALLTLLALIIVPTVNNLIIKQKEQSLSNLISNIEISAINYAKENKWELPISCENNITTTTVSLDYLLYNGYLKSNEKENDITIIKNPLTKENIPLTKTVTIYYDCNNKTFNTEFVYP